MQSYILITGASHGIGKAMAYALAENGKNLILTCKNSYNALLDFSSQLSKDYGITCISKECDMSNPKSVAALFSEVPAPDVVINNAGISYVGLLQDMSDEAWREVIDTNLSSAFYTSKHAIPPMLKRKKGHIINISSVWGNVGASTEVAYCASKGGLNAFTKALAKELAPSSIQVNAIACGLIDTRMNAHLSSEELQTLTEEIPAGRAGRCEEVAQTVLNVLSMPSYYTGQILTLDGAWI